MAGPGLEGGGARFALMLTLTIATVASTAPLTSGRALFRAFDDTPDGLFAPLPPGLGGGEFARPVAYAAPVPQDGRNRAAPLTPDPIAAAVVAPPLPIAAPQADAPLPAAPVAFAAVNPGAGPGFGGNGGGNTGIPPVPLGGGVTTTTPATPNPTSPTPEPATWFTMILGLGFAGALLRRSRDRRPALLPMTLTGS